MSGLKVFYNLPFLTPGMYECQRVVYQRVAHPPSLKPWEVLSIAATAIYDVK